MNKKEKIQALEESLKEITSILDNIDKNSYPDNTIKNFEFQKFQIQNEIWKLKK